MKLGLTRNNDAYVVREKTNNKKIKPHRYIGKKDIEPMLGFS